MSKFKNLNKKQMIIVVGIISAIGYFLLKSDVITSKAVKVETVKMSSISDAGVYSGIVIPGELVPVYIEAQAVVERIVARQGEEVNENSDLIYFSNKSLLENEKQLKINALDIENAKLRIADLESGTVKLELDNKKLEIKTLEEKIKNDSKKLPVVENQAKTYEKLLAEDGISSLEASKKKMEYEELKTNFELNKQKYNLMSVSYESLRRQLNIDEARINSELSKLLLKRETLELREKQLKEPLKSPVSGIIVNIDVSEGSVISPGERLVAIATKGENKVMLEVPSYQAEIIKKGQVARITTRNSAGEEVYKGVVEKVSSAAKSSSKGNDKIIEVQIKVEGENNLKPGFIVDTELSGEKTLDVPVVNSFSVVEENGDNFVYVIEDSKARKTKVKLGRRGSSNFEVLNLPINTKVIINPFKVKDGEKVKVVK